MPVALLILPFHPAMGITLTYQPQIVTNLFIDGIATDQTAWNIVGPQGQRGCSSEPETNENGSSSLVNRFLQRFMFPIGWVMGLHEFGSYFCDTP